MAALVQIMAWRRTGDKPLSEAMLVGMNSMSYQSDHPTMTKTVATLRFYQLIAV